jgi:WD40 repeat protein
VTASGDYTVKLWDLEKGLKIRTIDAHSDAVWDAKISPD